MRQGLWQAALAYALWGLFPLYFRLLQGVDAREVLAHRIVWSLVFVGLLLTGLRRWSWWRPALQDGRVWRVFTASALLIACNWFTYIWAIGHDRVLDASLGYFITPLANVLMGWLVLKERLRAPQWFAVGLAATGVLWLSVAQGTPPWIALILSASFSTYGLLRKTAPLGALEGLTLETMVLAPVAGAGLLWAVAHGSASFPHATPLQQGLLMAAGPVTAVPLLLFAAGARRIPLSWLGMLQYIGPTLQMVLGLWLFHEPFSSTRLVGFVIIWCACVVFSAELWWRNRKGATVSVSAS